MTHTDPKDRLVPLVDGLPDPHGRVHDGFRVSRAVGEEEPVVLVTDGVEVKVPGEDGDTGVAPDEGTDDVGLGAEIEEGDVDVPIRVEGVDFFGGSLGDEVLLGGVPVLVVSRTGLSDVFRTDG